MSILLVGESMTVRMELAELLAAAELPVTTAGTLDEALRALDRSGIRVVIQDLDTAAHDDPFLLLREMRLRPTLKLAPLFVLTSDPVDALPAADTAVQVFHKPYDAHDLLERVRSALTALRASGATILLVDDSPTFLDTLSGELAQSGYRVIVATSGEEALERLPEVGADAVLLDLMMPGWDGRETCRRIKQDDRWRDLPVLLMTAQDDRRTMLDAIEVGADDYIAKTGDFDVLRARLRAQLRRRAYEIENRRMREELYRSEAEAASARATAVLAETRARLLADVEEKNRKLAELNAELEAFAASVSHDLRAPARHVMSYARLLKELIQASPDDERATLLGRIDHAAQRMEKLIEALLSFSRSARCTPQTVPVSLERLVAEVIHERDTETRGRTVQWQVGSLPTVTGDPVLLRQVIDNLLGNALKFSRGSDPARIEVRAVPADSGEIVVEVRDNGVGFPADGAASLFGVFHRLHSASQFEGTGIGLANVRRIISRHGGRTWATSTPGEGAAFYFSLPAGESKES